MTEAMQAALEEQRGAEYDGEQFAYEGAVKAWLAAAQDLEPAPRFALRDASMADWAMRRLRDRQVRLREAEDFAREEIGKIRQWLDGERQRKGRDIEFFDGLLREYHERAILAALASVGGDWSRVKDKTLRLPSGEVAAAKRAPAWGVQDKAAFIEWAEAEGFGDLVKVDKDVRLAEAKKVFTARGSVVVDDDGEVVPGLVPEPEAITYTVKPL